MIDAVWTIPVFFGGMLLGVEATKLRAKAQAEYEAHCEGRRHAIRRLQENGWRLWQEQSPRSYSGLIEIIRLEESMAGMWNRPMLVRDMQPCMDVADLWWRTVLKDQPFRAEGVQEAGLSDQLPSLIEPPHSPGPAMAEQTVRHAYLSC